MKTIIIYSSKYGSTADCAKLLSAGLSSAVELANIDKMNAKNIPLENFDKVILGSSIYIGGISRMMRTFCNENVDILSKKRVGIFLCCGFPAQMNEYLAKNFPAALLKNAVAIENFGGEARVDKLKVMDKLIMKAATKGNYRDLTISHENIKSFIKNFNGCIN